MHPVFHVNLLKLHDPRGTRIPPPPLLVGDDLLYEIEQVLDYDAERKRYLIKWKDYGHEHNTFEPERNLKHVTD